MFGRRVGSAIGYVARYGRTLDGLDVLSAWSRRPSEVHQPAEPRRP